MNPAKQEQIDTVALGSEDDLNLAVAAANAAFESFSVTSKADRMDLLNSLMDVSRWRFEDLAQAMCTEMGARRSAWRVTRTPMPPSGIFRASSTLLRISKSANRSVMAISCFTSRSASAV